MKEFLQSSHGDIGDRSDGHCDIYTQILLHINFCMLESSLISNALQYGSKRGHSNTRSDQNSMLSLEDVCGRSAIWTINVDLQEI